MAGAFRGDKAAVCAGPTNGLCPQQQASQSHSPSIEDLTAPCKQHASRDTAELQPGCAGRAARQSSPKRLVARPRRRDRPDGKKRDSACGPTRRPSPSRH